MKTKRAIDDDASNHILAMIGKKLLELRVGKGYTSHETFAADHDLPRVQYWRMESGKANLTLRSLQKVLAIHKLSIEELFVVIARENKRNLP